MPSFYDKIGQREFALPWTVKLYRPSVGILSALLLLGLIGCFEVLHPRDTITVGCRSDTDCPADARCDLKTRLCVCTENPNALAPACTTCLPQFTGVNCDQCLDPHFATPDCTTCLPAFTGANCDQCADARFTGSNCDECADARFTGVNCAECAERFTGTNCDQCADARFTGANCAECADPHFAKPNCTTCLPAFAGVNCEECADPHFATPNCTTCLPAFTGANCDQCADSRFALPDCATCLPTFTGENCDQCVDSRFALPDCTTCLPRFMGTNCDECADPHFATPNCTTCLPAFTGANCDQCADARFTGANCDECLDPHFATPLCTMCLPAFTGANCDQCADARFTGANCEECADARFTGPNCDECADARFTGVNCDQCRTPGGSRNTTACPQWLQSTANSLYFTTSEVTAAQYEACVGTNYCTSNNYDTSLSDSSCNYGNTSRGDHPMNCVNWYGADEYCTWLGTRLPTEDEWYAEASNNGSRTFPWGNTPHATCSHAIMSDRNAGGRGCGMDSTSPVCSKPSGNSVSGMCDLSGNIWEWTMTLTGTQRVIRGGSWKNDSDRLRASSGIDYNPDFKYDSMGFRCASVSPPR